MVLHRMPDDIGDLVEATVVNSVKRPYDPSLHRLETVVDVRDGPVLYDIGCIFEEISVEYPSQV